MLISKPPSIENKVLNLWLDKLCYEANNSVNILWIPVVSPNATHGTHSTKQLTAGQSAYFEFVVPDSTKEIKEVLVRLFPTTTGTFDYTLNITFGRNGEDEFENNATKTADGISVTDDEIYDLDVTSCFSTIETTSSVGCQFVCDVLTTTTNLQVLGLILKFI